MDAPSCRSRKRKALNPNRLHDEMLKRTEDIKVKMERIGTESQAQCLAYDVIKQEAPDLDQDTDDRVPVNIIFQEENRNTEERPCGAVPVALSKPSTPRDTDTIVQSLLLAEAEGLRRETQRGHRRLFSPQQLIGLRQAFTDNAYPNPSQYDVIAKTIGMSERSARLWFQNVRARIRKRGPETVNKPTRLERHHIRVAAAVEALKEKAPLPSDTRLPTELKSALQYAKYYAKENSTVLTVKTSSSEEESKRAGLSWSSIGDATGVTGCQSDVCSNSDSEMSCAGSLDRKSSPEPDVFPLTPQTSKETRLKPIRPCNVASVRDVPDVKATSGTVVSSGFESMTSSILTPDHPFYNLAHFANGRKRKQRMSDGDPSKRTCHLLQTAPNASQNARNYVASSDSSESDEEIVNKQFTSRRRSLPNTRKFSKSKSSIPCPIPTINPVFPLPGTPSAFARSSDKTSPGIPSSDDLPLDLSVKKTPSQSIRDHANSPIVPLSGMHPQWFELMKSYRQMTSHASMMPMLGFSYWGHPVGAGTSSSAIMDVSKSS